MLMWYIVPINFNCIFLKDWVVAGGRLPPWHGPDSQDSKFCFLWNDMCESSHTWPVEQRQAELLEAGADFPGLRLDQGEIWAGE